MRKVLGNALTATGLGGYRVTICGHAYEIQKNGSSWLTTERTTPSTCRTVRSTDTLSQATILLAYDHFA